MFHMWEKLSAWIVFELFGLESNTHFGDTIHFFLYDTIKIFVLLISIIYIVSLLRSYFPVEVARKYIAGKNKIMSHILAALFGVVTPFCSCSAIPLFLGFLQARIPLGVTFSYLISAPMSDAVVIALLLSLFGWKIAVLYVGFGLLVAILGGLIVGALNLEKEVLIEIKPLEAEETEYEIPFKARALEAWEFTGSLFKKIYIYIILGVGVGAIIHGYVPQDFIVKYASGGSWYAVPLAVIMGIPMYASAAGILPLVEALTSKGMFMGTAISFMMAVVALSLPEAMILKRVLSVKLISIFFGTVGFGIMLVGYILNTIL
ncbi:MAG: permease [Campylobacteraceae bacterium]|nr:permease [Campylobacteraceae bacterium]